MQLLVFVNNGRYREACYDTAITVRLGFSLCESLSRLLKFCKQVKVKFALERAKKAQGGASRCSPTPFLTSVLDGVGG